MEGLRPIEDAPSVRTSGITGLRMPICLPFFWGRGRGRHIPWTLDVESDRGRCGIPRQAGSKMSPLNVGHRRRWTGRNPGSASSRSAPEHPLSCFDSKKLKGRELRQLGNNAARLVNGRRWLSQDGELDDNYAQTFEPRIRRNTK